MPDPDPAAPGQQFMSKQEAEEFIAKAFLQQKLINEQEQKENMRLARQMKIQQETYKYKRPADKRAVRYLLVGKKWKFRFVQKLIDSLLGSGI